MSGRWSSPASVCRSGRSVLSVGCRVGSSVRRSIWSADPIQATWLKGLRAPTLACRVVDMETTTQAIIRQAVRKMQLIESVEDWAGMAIEARNDLLDEYRRAEETIDMLAED